MDSLTGPTQKQTLNDQFFFANWFVLLKYISNFNFFLHVEFAQKNHDDTIFNQRI